jgi:hypothetical protein
MTKNQQLKFAVMKRPMIAVLTLLVLNASASLVVETRPLSLAGQKAVVRLDMKNTFDEEVRAARATVFLIDQNGKVQAEATHWVIGGNKNIPGLAPGATNSFSFVLTAPKALSATNWSTRIRFNRVILAQDKLANLESEVVVTSK